jgi:CheY-like chemotaxis protein/nitrogen-specific signal transduction histidine kinase
MALHAELSDELEQTNRGVVALYAELDEASTRLKEASESKTRFWASVSHELRTPLNSVLGLSRLLLDPRSDALTPEQRHQVEMIHDSGAMLLSLVNELLDVAKAESGRLEAHPEPTDLRSVFDQMRASMAPLAPADVALVVEEPPDAARLVTDPLLLGRILRNLVSNALKFTMRGEVRCRARADDGHLDVVVSDTGVGIPAEHRSRVFEEFHQVPGPLQSRAAGTGLGLPYARRVAELLGGSLDLDSAVDQGTTVTLRLPLDGAKVQPARFGAVLVVDDDPAFRSVVRHVLAPSADRVSEVGDGAGALLAMRFERPDLVLLDLDIPPPDGRTVLAEMRQDQRLDDVPVVVVTSAELDGDQRRMLETTAAVLHKSQFSGNLLTAAADVAGHLVRRSG